MLVSYGTSDPLKMWYQATQTNAGAFETTVTMLQTERTGGRPIFLGYKVRRACQR
jgi:hypothetical protein